MSLDLESMDSFASAHQRVVDKLSELMFTPKTFNPNIDEKKQNVRDRKLSEYQVTYVRTCQRSHVQVRHIELAIAIKFFQGHLQCSNGLHFVYCAVSCLSWSAYCSVIVSSGIDMYMTVSSI